MAKEKNIKTNAMRILDKKKIPYKVNYYECDEFIDGIHIADKLSQSYDMSFKTLVAVGKSKENYVFCLPVDKELDLKKAAKSVNEKSVELLHVKDIKAVTGYIRGGCTPIGMKKQFRTVIHSSALNFSEIIISGGALGVQLFITPESLAASVAAEFENIIFE
ncbi:MAG: Cys-tRNA(Pro) deacylase [Clostridia bacterium]|nr:Cys-tRNA(Pro) deacylase [Clostridia bacterium]